MKKENLLFFENSQSCPIRNVLSRFGDKWSILVLVILETRGTMRFNELNREIGDISQRMLTVTLRTLEADGLVTRKVYPEVPPRVEYTLTGMGHSLIPCIDKLVEWAAAHMEEVVGQRNRVL